SKDKVKDNNIITTHGNDPVLEKDNGKTKFAENSGDVDGLTSKSYESVDKFSLIGSDNDPNKENFQQEGGINNSMQNKLKLNSKSRSKLDQENRNILICNQCNNINSKPGTKICEKCFELNKNIGKDESTENKNNGQDVKTNEKKSFENFPEQDLINKLPQTQKKPMNNNSYSFTGSEFFSSTDESDSSIYSSENHRTHSEDSSEKKQAKKQKDITTGGNTTREKPKSQVFKNKLNAFHHCKLMVEIENENFDLTQLYNNDGSARLGVFIAENNNMQDENLKNVFKLENIFVQMSEEGLKKRENFIKSNKNQKINIEEFLKINIFAFKFEIDNDMNRHLIDLLLKFISFMKDTYFKKTEFLFKNDEFPKEKKINIENVYIAKNCMNENLFLFLQGEYYILVETLFNDYFDQNNINEKFFDVKEFGIYQIYDRCRNGKFI
ncbi:hypothetical protein GVAV_000948, partial [Gurleya vavrai]